MANIFTEIHFQTVNIQTFLYPQVDTVCKKTDALATAIRDHTYKKRTVPERICAFLEDDDAARSAEQPK